MQTKPLAGPFPCLLGHLDTFGGQREGDANALVEQHGLALVGYQLVHHAVVTVVLLSQVLNWENASLGPYRCVSIIILFPLLLLPP